MERKIVQVAVLNLADGINPHLFAVADDGTAWKLVLRPRLTVRGTAGDMDANPADSWIQLPPLPEIESELPPLEPVQ